MSINSVSRSSGVGLSGNDDVALSSEGKATIDQLRAQHQQLGEQMILGRKDGFVEEEERHRRATRDAIAAAGPTSRKGKGPQPGDPGVQAAGEVVQQAIPLRV